MIEGRLEELGTQLKAIESIALIPRVSSTLDLGNRVLGECIENELPVPSSLILAHEQTAGRGRGERTWHSPAGKGIYATLTFGVRAEDAPLLPLSLAVVTANFIRTTWDVDARLKWPNDILVGGRKIAGMLIAARHHGSFAYVAAGIGINVIAAPDAPENATSIREETGDGSIDLDVASTSFVRFYDANFERLTPSSIVLDEWRALTVHQDGDPIRCRVGEEVVSGHWAGIDSAGRAILARDGGRELISAGDLIDWKG